MPTMRRTLQRLAASLGPHRAWPLRGATRRGHLATFAGTCQPHHEARALAAAMALVGTGLFLAVLMTQEAALTTALVAGWR